MFNDERINQACGKIYSRGILLAVLYTALYAAARFLLVGEFRLTQFLTEIVILVMGCSILLIGLIFWGFSRDERAVFAKHQYYLTAGKVFVVAALAGYSVSIPLRVATGNDYPVNELILHLETLGCVYFFYAFKRASVSFNYTFIDSRGGAYYRRVFINIAKLAGILLAVFWGAAMLDLAVTGSFGRFLSILLAYIFSTVELGLFYLLLSALEKRNYDDKSPLGLKKGTTAALILAIGALAITALLSCTQGFLLRFSLTSGIGRLLYPITTAAARWAYPHIIITALALGFLLEQTLHSKWIRLGIGGILIMQTLDLALMPVKSVFMITMDRFHSENNQLLPLYGDIMNAWSFLVWLATLGFTCMLIHGLVRDFAVKKTLRITPVVTLACLAVGIFLATQNMYLARALMVDGGAVAVAIWQFTLMRKGNMTTDPLSE